MHFLRSALLATALVVGSGAVVSSPALAEGDAGKGKKVFMKCKACHRTEAGKHAVGPSLFGIVGRQAATADGFTRYSKAMRAVGESGLVWDDANISDYVADPKGWLRETLDDKKARGTMAFAGLKKEQDRLDLIAYLKTLQ